MGIQQRIIFTPSRKVIALLVSKLPANRELLLKERGRLSNAIDNSKQVNYIIDMQTSSTPLRRDAQVPSLMAEPVRIETLDLSCRRREGHKERNDKCISALPKTKSLIKVPCKEYLEQ